MKKLILSTFLFLGLALSGYSQPNADRAQKTPEERAQRMTDMMDKKLSLSESQKTQIYQVNLERARAMSNRKDNRQDKDSVNRRKEFETTENRIERILNANQKAEYQKLKEERKEKMKEHRSKRKSNR